MGPPVSTTVGLLLMLAGTTVLVWWSVRCVVVEFVDVRRRNAAVAHPAAVEAAPVRHWYDLDHADLGEDNALVNEWFGGRP